MNIDDDLSTRKLDAGLQMFKKFVGGDRIRARQLYEYGFEFNTTGKHLYAANQVGNPEKDEVFWRRGLFGEYLNHYLKSEHDTGP